MAVLDFIKHLFSFLTSLFLLSAVWVYIGRSESEDGTWLISIRHYPKDAFSLSILADYFVVNTVTTVGYGEVSPDKPLEMLMIMCYEVILIDKKTLYNPF